MSTFSLLELVKQLTENLANRTYDKKVYVKVRNQVDSRNYQDHVLDIQDIDTDISGNFILNAGTIDIGDLFEQPEE